MRSREITITNDKELRITSVELTEIINEFRNLESETTGKEFRKLQHKSLKAKIEKELKILESAGLSNGQNILLVEYEDSKGEKRPCYSLNRDGMLQMLNSESALVRYKTIEYINKIEEENNALKGNIKLISAQKEIEELKSIVDDFKKAAEEAKKQYKPSHKRKLQYDKLIKSVTSDKEEYQIVREWIFAILKIDKWEDATVDQHDKILEIISTTSRMININKFEQLSLLERM